MIRRQPGSLSEASVEICLLHVVEKPFRLTFVVVGSKPYDSLTVGEFLAHTSHIGDSLFIVAFTMTPETKHSPTKRHRTDNAAQSVSVKNTHTQI